MVKGLNEPGYGPGDNEPTEAQKDEDLAKGLAYLSSNAAKNPANDKTTLGWLEKIHQATKHGKKT